jgi:hypothetical protein
VGLHFRRGAEAGLTDRTATLATARGPTEINQQQKIRREEDQLRRRVDEQGSTKTFENLAHRRGAIQERTTL